MCCARVDSSTLKRIRNSCRSLSSAEPPFVITKVLHSSLGEHHLRPAGHLDDPLRAAVAREPQSADRGSATKSRGDFSPPPQLAPLRQAAVHPKYRPRAKAGGAPPSSVVALEPNSRVTQNCLTDCWPALLAPHVQPTVLDSGGERVQAVDLRRELQECIHDS